MKGKRTGLCYGLLALALLALLLWNVCAGSTATTPAGVLRIRGANLTLLAMTAGELRIGGRIRSVEWLGAER